MGIYEDDLAAALDAAKRKRYRPSNGTEGEFFADEFCAKCRYDAAYRADPDHAVGCPILAAALRYDARDEYYPNQWTYDKGQPTCTEFLPITEVT